MLNFVLESYLTLKNPVCLGVKNIDRHNISSDGFVHATEFVIIGGFTSNSDHENWFVRTRLKASIFQERRQLGV